MLEQLRLLLQLQAIDTRVQELEAAIAALPKPLEADKATLDQLEKLLTAEQTRFSETEAWRRDQEHTLALEEEAIRKAKAKLQAAKTPKDYSAATREVDNKRRAKASREEEVLKVMDALEKARTEIAAREQDVTQLRETVGAAESEINRQIDALASEATTHSAGRDALVAQIDERMYKRYERTRKQRRHGLALAKDGTCMGCHMALPPQLSNIVQRAESIETCPRCHRFLYCEEMLEELATSGEAAS